ncbi:hypothetical protein [Roseiflexus sp. RS-1]|uniref:hypothetical protein n=1 Tax=Roseiflexus sp. (strain RS-1) TaxID=357808 RepID=UPI0012EE01B9|nr:hypothetical protein [Roseiflexus sp. RS-1]
MRELIQRGEIPPHDILVLSCRDDLIEQLKQHVHQRKIDGYSAIFEKASSEKKDFNYNGKMVKVFAFLHTADKDGLPAKYRMYWFDNVEEMLTGVLQQRDAAEPEHSHAWGTRETESCATSFREILYYVMLFRYQRAIRQLRRHRPRGLPPIPLSLTTARRRTQRT